MFETARTVMGRRGQAFSAAEEQLYRKLYERTRLEAQARRFIAPTTGVRLRVQARASSTALNWRLNDLPRIDSPCRIELPRP